MRRTCRSRSTGRSSECSTSWANSKERAVEAPDALVETHVQLFRVFNVLVEERAVEAPDVLVEDRVQIFRVFHVLVEERAAEAPDVLVAKHVQIFRVFHVLVEECAVGGPAVLVEKHVQISASSTCWSKRNAPSRRRACWSRSTCKSSPSSTC